MKLRLKDKVMIISGRDKGKTGEILQVNPATNTVLVEGMNKSKKHKKPTQQDPRGGIIELTKPVSISKVQVLDPKSGKPARIGWKINADGTKDRIFKVASFSNKKAAPKTADKSKKETTTPKVEKTS